MDWYFVLCIVVFFAVGITIIFFAFQGPRYIDFDDSHYEEILKEEQHSHQNLNLTMPIADNSDEDEMAPAISLTSPYPQKPPPLGFGRILAERGGEVFEDVSRMSYPRDEDISTPSFPIPISTFSYVDPPSNFIKRKYPPPQDRGVSSLTNSNNYSPSVSTQTNVPCNIRNEPPPPYTEAVGVQPSQLPVRNRRFKKRLSQ